MPVMLRRALSGCAGASRVHLVHHGRAYVLRDVCEREPLQVGVQELEDAGCHVEEGEVRLQHRRHTRLAHLLVCRSEVASYINKLC